MQSICVHQLGVCAVAWLPNVYNDSFEMGWIASGSGDQSIVIFDLDSKQTVKSLRGHTGPVHSLLWVEEKGWLVSGSTDTTVRTWRVRSEV